MKKLFSTLLTIIFFQTQVFAFSLPFPVALNNYNSTLKIGDKQTYKTALKAIKEIPNNIKETYYATVNASNVENLQTLGYNIGNRVYDYKENPMLLAKDAARILTSYDMYEAGFNNDNMFYATGLILGGLALDIAGAPIKAGKGIVKTAKVTEKVANVGKELKVVENLTTDTSKYLGKDVAEIKLLPQTTTKNPWLQNTETISIKAPKDCYINMALAPGQNRPGAWGTFDNIPNVDYARNILAITPEFKPQISYVQKYLIPEGTRIQIGFVGAQKYNDVLYIGGGTQVQILNYADRFNLIPIGEKIKIK